MPRETALTLSVQEAGARYFGLGKAASYRAAKAGEIPTIKIGAILRVPVARMDAMMERGCAADELENEYEGHLTRSAAIGTLPDAGARLRAIGR